MRLSAQEQLAYALKHSKLLDVRTESACYPTVWKRLAAAYKTAGLKGPPELMNNKGALIKDSVNTKEGRWYPSGNTDFRVLGSSDYSHPQWNKIPEKYRGEGMAGAMAQAGYADEPQNAWDGNLKPGAVLQMWNSESDYKGIKSGSGFNTNDIQSKVRGALGAVEDIGHSAVFVGYKKTLGVITGMVFVDHKGTQTLSRASPKYSVVRGANLRDKKEV